jgi:hypothetical protein
MCPKSAAVPPILGLQKNMGSVPLPTIIYTYGDIWGLPKLLSHGGTPNHARYLDHFSLESHGLRVPPPHFRKPVYMHSHLHLNLLGVKSNRFPCYPPPVIVW